MFAPRSTGSTPSIICHCCSPDSLSARRSDCAPLAADPRVRAVIGVGTPVVPVAEATEEPRVYTLDFLQECTKPKLFVSGARDQFGPRAKLEALVASMPEPKKLVMIEGADHFFEGRLRELREAIEAWVKSISSQRELSCVTKHCAADRDELTAHDSHVDPRDIVREHARSFSSGRGIDW